MCRMRKIGSRTQLLDETREVESEAGAREQEMPPAEQLLLVCFECLHSDCKLPSSHLWPLCQDTMVIMKQNLAMLTSALPAGLTSQARPFHYWCSCHHCGHVRACNATRASSPFNPRSSRTFVDVAEGLSLTSFTLDMVPTCYLMMALALSPEEMFVALVIDPLWSSWIGKHATQLNNVTLESWCCKAIPEQKKMLETQLFLWHLCCRRCLRQHALQFAVDSLLSKLLIDKILGIRYSWWCRSCLIG